MQAVVLLADSAQADPAGKVHALGLGWSATSTPTPAAAICVFLRIPWTAANARHTMSLRLIDSDGRLVVTDALPEGLEILGEFEAGRPPGLPPGMLLDQQLAVPIPPGLPLETGQIYEWRLEIDGHHEESWSAKFFVRHQNRPG